MIGCRKYKVPSRQIKTALKLLVIGTSLNASVSTANDDVQMTEATSTSSSFMASYTLNHEPSGELLAQFEIIVGESGIRIDQQEEGGKGSVILNNDLNKMWLLDRGLEIVYEVSQPASTDKKLLEISSDEDMESVKSNVGSEYFAAFIQREPCKGMDGERAHEAEISLVNIQVWLCTIDKNIVEKQWFDSMHGIVVKSESFDGIVSTITNVSEISGESVYLEPPSNYRFVTLEEIVSISQPLNKYQENSVLSGKSVRVNNSMTESTNAKNNRYTVR